MTFRSFFARPPAVTSLLLTLLAGCGDPSEASRDVGQQVDMCPGIDPECNDAAIRYRITELHVPTGADVSTGMPVGHNLDAAGTVCGVPDFAGGVDNSLIELSTGLTMLNPDGPGGGVDLQALIDQALACPVDADPSECTRLDLIMTVHAGSPAFLGIEDGDGTSLAGPGVGSVDASGNGRWALSHLRLTLPYPTASGPVDIVLDITGVVLTVTIREDALTDIVLGGAILQTDFEAMLADVLPLIDGGPSYEDVQPILASLYDVQYLGECAALSVGFIGAASREP